MTAQSREKIEGVQDGAEQREDTGSSDGAELREETGSSGRSRAEKKYRKFSTA